MSYIRPTSLKLPQKLFEEEPNEKIPKSVNFRSPNTFTFSYSNRQRVPEALQSVLRSQMKESKTPRNSQEVSKSKIGQSFRSSVDQAVNYMRDVTVCQICEGEIKKVKHKNQRVCMCNCEHRDNFCESCLHHYVIYKVKSFEEVFCPYEGCPALLDMDTHFFHNLPLDIQKSYKKIHQFSLVTQNPELKLCPREDCEGILHPTSSAMVCEDCDQAFCKKCMLSAHEGDCESWQLNFFKENLHYRQCKRCKIVIQKNQGCNHMTCRCGYQFCYVCGAKWNSSHYGEHDDQGRLIEAEDREVRCRCCECLEQIQCCGCCQCCLEQQCCGCCQCECNCCQWIQETCGGTCAFILKMPLKIILLTLFLLLMLFILVFRNIVITMALFLLCILIGALGFSFVIVAQTDCPQTLLTILLFPMTMVLGIGMAFREIYCEVVPEIWSQYFQMLCEITEGIFNL